MENTNELLDAAKKKLNLENDTELGKELGANQQKIWTWRAGTGKLDTYAAWRLSEILDIEIPEILAIIESERAKTEEKKAFWEAAKKKIRNVSAVGAIGIAMAGSGYRSETYASPLLQTHTEKAEQLVIIM